ncbi:Multidrug resistance protein MdtN [compost metagenome]
MTFDDQPGRVFPARVDSVGWGIANGGESPTGQLPTVNAPTGWLREPQRFPVRIALDGGGDPAALSPGRSGAQASVVVLTAERSPLNLLARAWIWLVAQMSYLQ